MHRDLMTAVFAPTLLLTSAAGAGGDYCAEVDLTGCGCINAMSVLILLGEWGPADGLGDFDGDGFVGGFDLAYMLAHFSGTFGLGPCLPIPDGPIELALELTEETDPESAAQGLREFSLSVTFDDGAAVPLSVYGAAFEIVGDGDWVQNDFFSEWAPTPQFPGGACTCDSYVTIGVAPDFSTPVSLDPDFFLADPSQPVDVGWFVLPASPASTWPGNTVALAHLVVPEGNDVQGELTLAWRLGDEFVLGAGSFSSAQPADLNEDGEVDGADLGVLLSEWGGPGAGDLDGSGIVDGADVGLLLAAWSGG